MSCFGILVNGVQTLGSNLAFAQGADLSMGSGSQVLLDNGTTSLPGLAFVAETNLGLHRPATDHIALLGGGFTVKGTTLLDNLGISSIVGSLRVDDGATSFWWGNNGGVNSTMSMNGNGVVSFFQAGTTNNVVEFGSFSTHDLALSTGPSAATRWRLKATTGHLIADGTKSIAAVTRLNVSQPNLTPAFSVDGNGLSFFNATPVAKQVGVAITAAGIHAALVNYGLIAA